MDSAQNIRTAGYLNGIPSVTVIIFRQPGANIIDDQSSGSERQLAILAGGRFRRASRPPIVLDRTTTIRASVIDVEQTLIISVVLVILVVFVFLRNWRATLIPSVAVPVSLIGTFAVMYLLGYSLDNLSLMALTISTGFVVDDAIVVMENISRHLEQGMAPIAAALKGAQGDRLHRVHHQHVADRGVHSHADDGRHCGPAVPRVCRDAFHGHLVSMVISLTTTPMMCAYIAEGAQDERSMARCTGRSRGSSTGCCRLYRHSLTWVLDNPGLMLIVLLLTIALNVVLIDQDPQGIFPAAGHGRAGRRRARAAGRILPGDERFRSERLVGVIKADPAVANVNAFTAARRRMADLFTSRSSRWTSARVSAAQMINRLRPKLNRLPVASAFLAGGAGPAHRRARQQCAVPVHDPGGQCAGPEQLGADSAGAR